MAIQRFLSTKDLKSARRTFVHTQSGMVVITVLLLFVGFAVMGFYNIHPNLLPSGDNATVEADFLFPHFIANQFPPGMSGLVIAALFSASMSSLSSGVNSVGSIISADILPAILKNRKNLDTIRNIRIISIFIGVLAIVLSLGIQFVPGNIIEVTAKTNGLFIAPLFNLFVNALFIKKAKPFGVLMGSIYGFMVAFLIGFWDVLTGNPPLSFLWIAFVSLIVSLVSSLLFNYIFPSTRGKKAVLLGIILVIPWVILFSVII
jgi:SSS family solute:Na+ symporter